MNDECKIIIKGILQFLMGGVLSLLAIGLYVISFSYPLVTESWLEIGQEALLFFSAFYFALAADRAPDSAGGLHLVAGFTSLCFLRELDACFDIFFHGAWKVFILAYLVFLFFVLRKDGFPAVLSGLARYLRSRSFAMFLPGVVIILAYSRFFGMKALWRFYLPPDVPIGAVKTFSEESVEFLGYAIIFCSSLVAAFEKGSCGVSLKERPTA